MDKTITKLKAIAKDKATSELKSEVAEIILDHLDSDTRESLKVFFKDLFYSGCVSGMISPLIYYKDTHAFYDRHYNEIEELREELESSFGEALQIKSDLKNYFAWLAFEETARKIAEDLNIEI